MCSDSIFFDLPNGKTVADYGIRTPADYSFQQFKAEVGAALSTYFGVASVTRGDKAFDVHENTYRIDADVVACFEYRRYGQAGPDCVGTAFLSDKGLRIINWPEQNYENGVAKNDETGRRFKSTVRILKRLRNEMNGKKIAAATPMSSFLIECLVWNVPREAFGHDSYRADVRWALAHLFNNTLRSEDCRDWGEINELKYLFHPSKPWTVESVHAFLSAAWDYLGFE